MFLHVGEDVLIQTKKMIAILDFECLQVSPLLKEFIGKREKERTTYLTSGPYKSIVITEDHIFFSPFSAGTLKKRLSESPRNSS